MHPTLFTIGSFTIYSYGVMVAVGFAAATLFIYRSAPLYGFDKNKIIDMNIIALVTGIVGARLLYVLMNLGYYLNNPFEIPNLSRGGLVWYGGFLAAAAFLFIYTRMAKCDFWNLVDLMAPYVAMAQAFGRIGCFLNGCCYGIGSSETFIFKVKDPGDLLPRHPTQIYSALALFTLFLILRAWQARRRFSGEIFLGYCILYAVERFIMEFFRGDNPKIFMGLTMSQEVCLVIFAVATALFLYKALSWKRNALNSK